MRKKQWGLRRFLHDLATKKQTVAEMNDHVQWMLNEYRDGMKRRKIKIVNNTVSAVIIPAADMIFNPTGNHIVSAIGALIAINRVRIELLDGEMKAPGREVAYIYDAQRRFGSSS